MRNNYEKLTSPKDKSSAAVLNLKRLGKSSIRASFRMSKRIKCKPIPAHNIPLNRDLLPAFIPPKAAALLQIDLHFEQAKQSQNQSMANTSNVTVSLQPIKNATIRKKSVWANNSASKDHFFVVVTVCTEHTEGNTLNILQLHYILHITYYITQSYQTYI